MRPVRYWIAAMRSGVWLTDDRVRGYTAMLLVFELIAFVFCIAGTHGWIVTVTRPTSSDFVSFYAAGMLANAGTPALVYDHAAHYAAEQQATEPGIVYNFFYYPPMFLLLCAALARLPYLGAFVLFQTSCLLPCLALARRILGDVPLWTFLAFPAVFWAVGTGQNALLTAALLAAATLTIDRRPVLAGILFGALCYKPHLGLLLPIALAAGGHWRAFAAAAASVATLVTASLVAFGWSTWHAFVVAAAGGSAVYASRSAIDLPGSTSPFGLTLALGGSPALAVGLQCAASVGVAAVVAWVWWQKAPLAVRAAILLAGIPVAVPVVMFYDLMIIGLAMAWLVAAGRESGFPTWQRTGLALLFLLPLLSGNFGDRIQLFFAPAGATLGLLLALRQTYYRNRHAHRVSTRLMSRVVAY